MKRAVVFMIIGLLLSLCISDLYAMQCQIVDEEGNAIYAANAGDLVYFASTYASSKSKKLAWNLMVTMPSLDVKNFKTSMKHNGYFYHEGSLENKSHVIPFVIPGDSFIEGNATFKYTLTGNGNCTVYLNVAQDPEAPSEPTPPIQANKIKTLTTGETWNYIVTGTFSNPTTSINLNGTATSQILPSTKRSPVSSKDCLDAYSVLNLSGAGNPLTVSSHSYIFQDVNGSIYSCGRDIGSGDLWVTSPAVGSYLNTLSPVSIGQSGGGSVVFSDGSTLSYSYSVTALENITTEKGTFEAFRISSNATYDYAFGQIDREVETNTEWFVPSLGRTVKSVSSASAYKNGVYQYALSLTMTLQ